MDYEIRKIEAEYKLTSMRRALLSKSCNVDVINKAWEIKKQIRRSEYDKRF